MSLYEGAVKKPIMTTLCFVAVMILGLFSLSKLPVDLYPDIDTNTIMVITTYPGASASDIENNVTRPLENTLNSVEHLKHITSQSRENTSVITLEFEYGNDIEVITNDVRDKLDMVSSMLPDESNTPIIFKFSTDMIPIVILSVQADESQNALYKILDDNVANPLAVLTVWEPYPFPVRRSVKSTSIWMPARWKPMAFRWRRSPRLSLRKTRMCPEDRLMWETTPTPCVWKVSSRTRSRC